MNRLYIILSIISVSHLLSCSEDDHSIQNEEIVKKQVSIDAEQTVEANKCLSKVEFGIKPNHKETPYRGVLREAAGWEDARGKNILIISELQTSDWRASRPEMVKFVEEGDEQSTLEELFAWHYILGTTGKWRCYWNLNDFNFQFSDRGLEYMAQSLKITDRDKDGNAETCFSYYDSQVPIDLHYTVKMILHVDSNNVRVYGGMGAYKYIFKEFNESLLTPEYNAQFKKLNPEMQKYAVELWDGYSSHQDSLDRIREKEWESGN